MKNKKINIVQDEKAPIPVDVMAKSIVNISNAIKKLNEGQLNTKAITVLICHSSKENRTTVENVLHSIETLARDYVK